MYKFMRWTEALWNLGERQFFTWGDLFFAYKIPLKYRSLYFGVEHNQSLRKSSWISFFRILSVGL